MVLTGGTALNCAVNMQLLEPYDEEYYERYLGNNKSRLHLGLPRPLEMVELLSWTLSI